MLTSLTAPARQALIERILLAEEIQRRGLSLAPRLSIPQGPQASPYARYWHDPIGYAQERLHVHWWADQQAVARSVVEHPKTLVKAGHSVGKTMMSGGMALWHFETRVPGITLTTAPSGAQVNDLLWKEIRTQSRLLGLPFLPKAPVIQDPFSEMHYAKGYTARDSNSFQGRHEEYIFIIFDEATGIPREFWTAAEGMTTGPDARWLAILNPTDPNCQAYEEELTGEWNIISINAMTHPNIAAELRGERPPFPKAVRLSHIEKSIRNWCTPIEANDHKPTDVEWPPASGQWYRPGPDFEARVLGRWPSIAIGSVWSDALLAVAFREGLAPLPEPQIAPVIGCDVARYGDDYTSIHIRRGAVSLHHETHNGWSTAQTAGRLKQLAREYGQRCGTEGRYIQVNVDDDGIGGGVVDQADDYDFRRCSGASAAIEQPDDETGTGGYPNRRSEAWFVTMEKAQAEQIDLSRLDQESKRLLRAQLRAPTWKLDNKGRRTVEPKDMTKKRLKRSPDDADAFNLAHAQVDAAIPFHPGLPAGGGWSS